MIKVLNFIEGTNLVRIEVDKKISLIYKDDLEALQRKENKIKDEEKVNTLCGFPFDRESYGCRTCDNFDYCKEQEKKKHGI